MCCPFYYSLVTRCRRLCCHINALAGLIIGHLNIVTWCSYSVPLAGTGNFIVYKGATLT